jgi:diguanylate cyclase (GGDEF)-like protein
MWELGLVTHLPHAKRLTPAPLSQLEMALDTVAAILRILGEHDASDEAEAQEVDQPGAFARACEQWAQHVAVGTVPPGIPPAPGKGEGGRRDWGGVREFVRDYCRKSATHTRTVLTDLRQVIWVFIQNLNHSLAQEQEADGRIRTQLERLETLARGSSTGELKREVMSAVVAISHIVEERRKTQRARVEALGTQVKVLGSELETVRKESEVDPLTRLYNRKAFDDYLARSVELAHAFGQPSCLLLIDIDRFKTINDTFGHPEGDAVLRRISDAMIRIFLRKSDFVARYGGDELAVVLRETSLKEGLALCDRLMRAVRAIPMDRENVHFQLTLSIGASALGHDETADAWLKRTDHALYDAKRTGRDRVAASVG